MGSGLSRQDVIDSKRWETKAQKMLISTTNPGRVKVICSLLPFEDERTAVQLLKARPDLDTLYTLHYKHQDLCMEHHIDPSSLTAEFKANEIWRVLRMPVGYGKLSWDWDWQPPLSGTASKIADELHAAVCRAVFRIPFLDLIKWALGYNALFVGSLFDAVCDVRNSLRRAVLDAPGTKDTYVQVEKILESRQLKLAHWIVASSLSHSPYSLQDTLALMRDPIRNLFAIRNLNLVLERLPVFEQRWKHIKQEYDWEKWSMDLDIWNCTCQALWTGPPDNSDEDSNPLSGVLDEKLVFLRNFKSVPQNRVHGRRLLSLLRRL